MSLNLKIVKNYSQALYSRAQKSGLEDKVLEQLLALNKIVLHSPKVMQAFCSPIVDNKIKKKLLDLIASKLNFEKATINFLYTLIENSRFSLIFEMLDDFSKIIALSKNIKYIQVSSAYKLGKKEIDLISGILELEIGKKVKLETNIDPSLIGGVVIQYDCNLIDCSVSGALNRIKKIALNSEI